MKQIKSVIGIILLLVAFAAIITFIVIISKQSSLQDVASSSTSLTSIPHGGFEVAIDHIYF